MQKIALNIVQRYNIFPTQETFPYYIIRQSTLLALLITTKLFRRGKEKLLLSKQSQLKEV